MGTDFKSGQKVRLHDEDNIPYSSSNPVPVSFSESENGTEIHDYDDTDVVKDTSENHDYTVTALKTLFLNRVNFSSSARCKIDVQIETGVGTDTFDTIGTGHIKAGNDHGAVDFGNRPKRVAAGIKVRVVKTNQDNQDAAIYSTIVGLEL